MKLYSVYVPGSMRHNVILNFSPVGGGIQTTLWGERITVRNPATLKAMRDLRHRYTAEDWERIRHTWTKEMAMDPDGGPVTPATESPATESSATFGPRERSVSDTICDRSLSKAKRAKLLRQVGNDREFNSLPLAKAQDVPLGFLDTMAGRQWYCDHGGAGCEVVRCSDPGFFKNVARKEDSDDVDLEKVTIDPNVRKAINADSPAQLMMRLSVSGKRMDARLLAVILSLRKTKVLEWLLENDEKTKGILDERRMLFYVCANWPYQNATDWLEKAEAKQPGIIKSCVDALGRNLLWYTQYNRRHGRAEKTLLKHGCDPDAKTVWGLSWRNMKAAR